MASMKPPLLAIAAAVAALLLPVIFSRIHLSPITALLLTPLALLIWLVSIPIAHLAIAFVLDHLAAKRSAATSARNGWKDDSGALRRIRPLAFTTPAAWSVRRMRAKWARTGAPSFRLPLHPDSEEVSAAADRLIALIMRDFVLKWHAPLSAGPDAAPEDATPEFPHAVERTIREALGHLLGRAGTIDLPTLGVRHILPMVTRHVDSFRKAEAVLRGGARPAALHPSGSDEFDLFLAGRYADGKLHPAVGNIASLNTRPTEEAHLRKIAVRALNAVLPEADRESRAVFVVVRELVACAVLWPIVDMLSDPDYWNKLIDQKAGAAIHEQKMVNKLREALDKQGVSTSVGIDPSLGANSALPQSGPDAVHGRQDHHSFDSFLKSIARTNSILEARRLKNDINMQIRKTKAAVANGNAPPDSGSTDRSSNLVVYLERLQVALTAVEQRIAVLSGNQNEGSPMIPEPSQANERHRRQNLSLQDVLVNPSTLSYFMEFMDRRKRSMLVQFWLIVDSFKDPLEDIESESEDETNDDMIASSLPPPSLASVRTLKEDLRLFSETYYSSNVIKVKPKYIAAARYFLDNVQEDGATARQVQKARHSVLKAQRQVYTEMIEDDWPSFKAGDLYLKAVEDFSRDPESAAPQHRTSAAQPKAPIHPDRRGSGTALPPMTTRHESMSGIPRLVSSPTPRRGPAQPSGMVHSTSAHADLFGQSSPPLGYDTADGQIAPSGARVLFSDLPGPSVHSSPVSNKGLSRSENLDFLIGGKTARGGDRAPLFDEPLFDDDEEDAPRSSHRESEYVHVETMDAIQHALTSIINEDHARPLSAGSFEDMEASYRPRLGRSRATSQGSTGSGSGVIGGGLKHPRPSPKMSHGRGVITHSSARHLKSAFKPSGIKEDPDALARRRRPVFDDQGWGSDEERSQSDLHPSALAEDVDAVEEDENDNPSVQLAAPGDLQLGPEIVRLGGKIEKLTSQEEILQILIRKAELTGAKETELRLLNKSRSAVARELRETKWQKEQYEAQEEENAIVAGRTSVGIPNSTIGHGLDGKEYALYLIEVKQHRSATRADNGPGAGAEMDSQENERNPAFADSGWVVGRRYSEFWALHQRLKESYAEVRALEGEFPGKRLVGLVHAPFVDARRLALERYVQALVKLPRICQSAELRAFLSQSALPPPSLASSMTESKPALATPAGSATSSSAFPGQGLVRSLFRGVAGVAEGLDDMFFGPSMFDVVIQRLSTQVISSRSSSTEGSSATNFGAGIPDADLVSAAMQQELGTAQLKEAAAAGTTYFTEPICDLFVEIFELKQKENWLRRQAVVIILQQVLGGTIERKLRETVKALLGPGPLLSYIGALQGGMWPDGQLKAPTPPRTPAEKAEVHDSANKKLSTLIPDLAASAVGRGNARRGARRIFSVLQNRRLNKHLIFTIIDEVVDNLFPESSER